MRKRSVAAVLAALIVVGSLPAVAGATIGSVSGQVIKIAPPPSVLNDALQHPTSIYAFDERQGVTLLSNLRVDIVTPGTYDQGSDLQNTDVIAGTKVDSHYLHSDRSPGGVTNRVGTVTFPTDILGVIVQTGRLPDSDALLGAPGTAYQAQQNRGYEFGGGSGADIVILPDHRTLQVNTNTSTGSDDLRVVTRHNSSPVANAGPAVAAVEGSPVTLTGTASDPDGDPITRAWTFTWTGDPGTQCTATGTATLTPTLTCTDDALVTSRLTVNDGINPAVSSTSTVTAANTIPLLDPITAPTTPVPLAGAVSISAPFTDPGTNDTHTATVTWGDTTSSSATVTETAGAGSLSASHTYAAPGIYTVTVTLKDDDLGTDVRSVQVAVDGPPTADAGGPYNGGEGGSVGLVGTAVDPENDPLTTTWSFTPSGLDAGGSCTTTGATTLLPTVTCDDDAVVATTLSASDGINPAAESSTTVTIDNEAPELGAPVGPTEAVPTGAAVSLEAPFADLGGNDTHTATISWGDLTTSPATITETDGSGVLEATHAYSSPGNYTVTILLNDDDLGSDSATLTILVNSPPTADAGGPYVGSEGDTLTLAGTAVDLDGDTMTTSWAFSWTGAPAVSCIAGDTDTLSPTLTCNDDTTVTATLTVDDDINAPVSDTATLLVGNLGPETTAVVPSANPAPSANPVSVSVSFSDPGAHDTHTATIDWGDSTTSAGSVSESGGSGTVSGSHTYATHGTFSVTVTVADDDSGSATSSVDVTANGRPTVDAGGPYSGQEGTSIALSGDATDPDDGALDVAWTFTWTGDPGTACLATGTATLTPVLTCTDDATVTAKLTVTDSVNPPVVDTATVSVGNATPTVSTEATPSQSPIETGGAVSVGLTFGDQGTNDTHTASVGWGDASSSAGTVSETNGSGSVSASHVYSAPGTYQVTVTVTDDDGGHTSSTTEVVVNGAPTVGAGGPYEGVEGAGVTLNGNAADPDADTLSITWTKTIVTADPGTTCALTGEHTLTPTLTCNDDATVTATISVADGVNPAVVDTATVTILNADPIVSAPIVLPNPVATGVPVNLSSGFVDPGANDDHTSSIAWGDASTSPGTLTETLGMGGTVTGTHTFTAPGTYTVKVTVNDKDGGKGTATATLVVSAPPAVDAGGPYSTTEGTPKVLAGTAADADGDPLGISWTFTWTGSPGTACVATDTTTLTPSVTCDDDAVVTAKLTADDAINAAVTDTATLTVGNALPVVTTITLPGGTVSAGTPVPAVGAFTDSGVHDTHTASIDWGDGVTTTATVAESAGAGAGTASGSHSYAAAGTFVVKVTVTDDNGGVGLATSNLVVNGAPTVSAGGPYSGFEGSTLELHGTASDPDLDGLGISWSFTWTGKPGTSCSTSGTSSLTPSLKCDDDAVVTATLTVTDGVNPPVVSAATATIANVAPTVGVLSVPVSPVPVGSTVKATAQFGDAGRHDTHTAIVNWGDMTTSAASVTETSGSGTAKGSKTYTSPGTFTVTMTVYDDDTGSIVATAANRVVVYDRDNGFVTGGGWITSPASAYTPAVAGDVNVAGRGNFGFVSKYVANQTVPTGETEFNLRIRDNDDCRDDDDYDRRHGDNRRGCGDDRWDDCNRTSSILDFHSTGYTYLVVEDGQKKAYYQGTGRVNGVSGYDFLVSMIDGRRTHTADTFRIRVTKSSTGVVIYDNQAGAPVDAVATQSISNGSIVIH